LLEEFKNFLPENPTPPQVATVSRVRHDEKNITMHSARSVQTIKVNLQINSSVFISSASVAIYSLRPSLLAVFF